MELTLEQEFELRRFELEIKDMNLEQAQAMLVCFYGEIMAQDNMYDQLVEIESCRDSEIDYLL